MNETIVIKSDYVLDGLIRGKYPDILREMAFIVIASFREYGIVPTMTSSFREGDKGVHGHYRGLDFRTWELTKIQLEGILNKLNQMYKYDPKRPWKSVLFYHDTGRGPHLHLQSHPNTIKVNGVINERILSGGGVQGSERGEG